MPYHCHVITTGTDQNEQLLLLIVRYVVVCCHWSDFVWKFLQALFVCVVAVNRPFHFHLYVSIVVVVVVHIYVEYRCIFFMKHCYIHRPRTVQNLWLFSAHTHTHSTYAQYIQHCMHEIGFRSFFYILFIVAVVDATVNWSSNMPYACIHISINFCICCVHNDKLVVHIARNYKMVSKLVIWMIQATHFNWFLISISIPMTYESFKYGVHKVKIIIWHELYIYTC